MPGKYLSLEDWNKRFYLQSCWTEAIRHYIFNKISLKNFVNILEVGCGTGIITSDLNKRSAANIIGVDILNDRLVYASVHDPQSSYICGDALALPFRNKTFNLTLCHFFLLWMKDPLSALREMVRTTRTGGYIAALAEPDYGGRIDYPKDLEEIGKYQSISLSHQGANINIGRSLRWLFTSVNLVDVEVGVLGGQWMGIPSQKFLESEWQVLEFDLSGIIENKKLLELKKADLAAWESGQRVIFVPTFYAFGKVL